jgi:hypothetical protein
MAPVTATQQITLSEESHAPVEGLTRRVAPL